MDKIFIEALEVDTVIGVYDWEKQIRQRLVLDLQLGTDIRRAAADDDIDQTLNYAKICEDVTAFISQGRFELVETVAEQVAERILARYPCHWLRLTLHKPGAVSNARSVGVCIERSAEAS